MCPSPNASRAISPQRLEQLAGEIKQWGMELGFQQVGITDTDLSLADTRQPHPTSTLSESKDAATLTDVRRAAGPEDIRPLWVEEREIIERAIALCGGNVVKAAAQLGISDSTIYRKRSKWATSR